jgi:hypothetical protein
VNDYEIRTEQRAFHWVAWAVARGETRPIGPVLMVGQTETEAEARLRAWLAARA